MTEGWRVAGQSTDINLCVVTNASTPDDFAAVAQTSDALHWIAASHLADTMAYNAYMVDLMVGSSVEQKDIDSVLESASSV